MLVVALLVAVDAAAVAKKSEWKDKMLFRERLIAGAASRGVAQTCLHPIDVARTRLQAKGVAMQFTPQTFVKGVGPQFLLAFPAGAMQFASYEFCKAKAAAIGIVGATSEVRRTARAAPRRGRGC